MATYNGAQYIRDQIDSILRQTVSDFELLIIDDCSTDGTWDILKQYSESDNRLRIVRNEKNVGFKQNFENAIRNTTGEYIALCDQDDIWLDNHLEVLLDGIGTKAIACGDSILVDSNNKPIGMTLSYQEALDNIPENDLKKAYSIFYFRSPFQGAGMLIKRSFVEIALPIPEELNYHDVWFSGLACFCGGINYIKRPISRYRQHGTNVSGNRFKRRSRFGTWMRHILRSKYLHNRQYAANQILNRVNTLTEEERQFLELVIRHGKRKSTIFGRILNSLFELKNYKLIYSCEDNYLF